MEEERNKAILELFKNARTIKRQLKILKGLSLDQREKDLMNSLVRDLQETLNSLE